MALALSRKRRLSSLGFCLGLVLFMGAVTALSPTLYRIFCQVTGFGGTTGVAAAPLESDALSDRFITVRFTGRVASSLAWSLAPATEEVVVRLGESTEVAYLAVNRSDAPLAGTATFNVTPDAAGAYFNKIDCFCFTRQELSGGETVRMPVVFFVDPEIVNDPVMGSLPDITLSYTFYPLEPAQAEGSEGAALVLLSPLA